ncbi:hypothetical protein AB0N05_23495 [Nocardia sp. NPDC051030]|uniref:hypothetical protein n=1 Tax=Nocardia sp. NPDC051030 TaxID=3155162 RepID=UPI0034167914
MRRTLATAAAVTALSLSAFGGAATALADVPLTTPEPVAASEPVASSGSGSGSASTFAQLLTQLNNGSATCSTEHIILC